MVTANTECNFVKLKHCYPGEGVGHTAPFLTVCPVRTFRWWGENDTLSLEMIYQEHIVGPPREQSSNNCDAKPLGPNVRMDSLQHNITYHTYTYNV